MPPGLHQQQFSTQHHSLKPLSKTNVDGLLSGPLFFLPPGRFMAAVFDVQSNAPGILAVAYSFFETLKATKSRNGKPTLWPNSKTSRHQYDQQEPTTPPIPINSQN